MTDEELELVFRALKEITENLDDWAAQYDYSPVNNEFYYNRGEDPDSKKYRKWFEL